MRDCSDMVQMVAEGCTGSTSTLEVDPPVVAGSLDMARGKGTK